MPTAIWAHRGASAYAPENTLEAIELALRMGADGIELDVHRTRAVSYTHLDVYKRQIQGFNPRILPPSAARDEQRPPLYR